MSPGSVLFAAENEAEVAPASGERRSVERHTSPVSASHAIAVVTPAKSPQLESVDAATSGTAIRSVGQLQRVATLDGLRGIAIMLVLLTKLPMTPGFPSAVATRWDFRWGAVGVDLFFVISGYLITTLLIREQRQCGAIHLPSFYMRRSLRILPAYGAYLGVLIAAELVQLIDLSRWDWLAAFTYTVNFQWHPSRWTGHIWSLSVEEHFYLLWPWLVVGLGFVRAGWFAVAVLALSPLARGLVLLRWPEAAVINETWTCFRLDGIAAGCLLAIVGRTPDWERWLDRLLGQPLAFPLIAGCLAGTLSLHWSTKFSLGPAPSIIALCLTGLLWQVLRWPTHWSTRWLSHPWLTAVGVLSYSLYLWHRVCLPPATADLAFLFPGNVVLLGIIAWLSYTWIEQPALRFKERWVRVGSGPRS